MKSLSDFWIDTFLEPFGSKQAAPTTITFPDAARGRHTFLLGGIGAGKSRFIEGLVVQDVVRRLTDKSGRGVGVIDVHGDLYENLRARLALVALRLPELSRILYLLDPTLPNWTIKYNPLELRPGELPERKADLLASIVTAVFQDDPTIVTRMRWLLWHAFLTLILAELPLASILPLLRDSEFRERVVSGLGHPELTGYWLTEFPGKQREGMAWAESSLDRMGRFLTNPYIAPLLQGPSTIDFRQLMDTGATILINASKGHIGEDASYLLCAFLLAEFQQAALSRVDTPFNQRTPFALMADEFANYGNDTVRQIVEESRKFGLELLLAGQGLGQIRDERLRSSLLNSVGNVLSFRLGYEDAEILVKSLFTPALDQTKPPASYNGNYSWRSLAEIWEAEIRKLSELPDRTLWWKRKGQPGSYRIEAFPIKDVEDLPEYNRLPQALFLQEQGAYRLAGVPRVRVEQPSSHQSSQDNNPPKVIYLPPPVDDEDSIWSL